jgi:hypothetical protein
MNSPLRVTDFKGNSPDLNITGEKAEQATAELQKSTTLTLSRGSEGKIT